MTELSIREVLEVPLEYPQALLAKQATDFP